MMSRNFKLFVGVGLASTFLIGGIIGALVAAARPGRPVAPASAQDPLLESPENPENAVSFETIQPKRDPTFQMTTGEEPGYVEAYNRADLQARQAGPVKVIRKDIGAKVTKGEILVQIDVPDLVQEVAQKEAVIQRSRMDLALAQKQIPVGEAAVEVAQNDIGQKEALVDQAKATMDFRRLELKRAQVMVSRNAVYEQVADERQRDYEAAVAAHKGAQVAVSKATADWKEAKAKLDALRADVNLKQALIDVAAKDRDRTLALADYAKVVAPFEGVITHRNVGPGSFVQNASTGHVEPLLTVERTDIVTLSMRVPDNYAPYVTLDTEALIEMSELPGQVLHGKVTRFSPCLQGDRRMRVEVDLYNGTKEDYHHFLDRVKTDSADLNRGGALPLVPQITGKNATSQPHPLLPGMFGTMKLVLRTFHNAYLVPSSVIVSEGGKPYIFEVQDHKVHLVPVDIQIDDGKLAKVAAIVKVGTEEVKRDLTGDEEIICNNQGELTEGQEVKTHRVDW
jgi:multidrug efflux pump subunit AcrA (membrane-fusion protein)